MSVISWPVKAMGWAGLVIGLTGLLVTFLSNWKVALGVFLMMIGDNLGRAAQAKGA